MSSAKNLVTAMTSQGRRKRGERADQKWARGDSEASQDSPLKRTSVTALPDKRDLENLQNRLGTYGTDSRRQSLSQHQEGGKGLSWSTLKHKELEKQRQHDNVQQEQRKEAESSRQEEDPKAEQPAKEQMTEQDEHKALEREKEEARLKEAVRQAELERQKALEE